MHKYKGATFKDTNNLCCPDCFSPVLYKYGKNADGFQKYQCQKCFRQFSLKPFVNRRHKGYPTCPICGKGTFAWHKYDTYIHFKCNDKKCNYSFKVPIWLPSRLKTVSSLPNENTFQGFRFPPSIILLVLSLYFDSSISTRAIKRFLMRVFCISVSHVTISKWTKRFCSLLKQISSFFLSCANLKSDEWHADETIVKINGVKHFLWVLLDSETRVVISFFLSPYRDSTAASALSARALLVTNDYPNTIITDRLDSYNYPLSVSFPNSMHYPYHGFLDYLNNNFIVSFNKTFKAWYKTKKGFKTFLSANDLITTFIFHYNFLHQHSSLNDLSPAAVAGVSFHKRLSRNWFLF